MTTRQLSTLGPTGLRANTLRHVLTGYPVGQGSLSRMGFPVPTCSPTTRPVPLVFVPWQDPLDAINSGPHGLAPPPAPLPAVDLKPDTAERLARAGGGVYRIHSGQAGLDRADAWFNATDITVPSIIYRDFIPHNNPMAYAFLLWPREPGSSQVLLQSALSAEFLARDPICNRIVTVPQVQPDCWFQIGA